MIPVGSARRRVGCALALALGVLLVAARAAAQIETPRPLELPDFAPPPREPGDVLPPIPLPETPDTEGLDAGLRIFIRGVRVTGNTVVSDAAIAAVTQPYTNRVVSSADLTALRDALTRLYVDAGYVSSGAILPDQSLDDGIVDFEIQESGLGAIEIHTNGFLRESFLRAKLRYAIDDPVNLFQIEEQLQLLEQDPRIDRVEARFLPGPSRGESKLVISLVERHPFVLGAQFDNYHSPAIGAQGGAFDAAWTDVTGYGDSIAVTYDKTEGLDDVETHYRAPLGPWGTSLELRMRKTWSDVVNPPEFKRLDIKSRTTTWAATLRQEILRSRNHDLSLFLTGERRLTRSKFEIDGEDFDFPTEGSENGRTKMTLLRLGGDWIYRGRSHVLAMRSTLTWGVGVFDITRNSGDVPDGRFLAWLGQAQYAQRLPWLRSQLVARFDLQLSDDPLLAIEQFSVGGHASVRGYRENQEVRDQGLAGSLEWRIPVWSGGRGFPSVEIAPFFDFGNSWNRERDTGDHQWLLGAGGVVRVALTRFLSGELVWGQDLKDVRNVGDNRLQDSGVFFRIRLDLP
ncbi:MAG: ShlB/FhaC/HecB family hemolysin secretion/activation protein [Myxococcota bacterium]